MGWLDSRAILIWKSDADILGLQQKVREVLETVRCQRPWPAGASRAREMVRKKSAHAKCRGWDRVGAKQMLEILGERRAFRSADWRRRARRARYLRPSALPSRGGRQRHVCRVNYPGLCGPLAPRPRATAAVTRTAICRTSLRDPRTGSDESRQMSTPDAETAQVWAGGTFRSRRRPARASAVAQPLQLGESAWQATSTLTLLLPQTYR